MRLAVLLVCSSLLSVAANLLCFYPASAASISVINLDVAGEGFNDPSPPDADSTAGGNGGTTLGAQRLIAFQHAADIWGGLLFSPVEIRVGANFDPLECDATSAVLGSAGPNTAHRDFVGAPLPNTWYTQALANSHAAMDLAPDDDDMGVTFNSSIGTSCPFPTVWYYGLDANPPAGAVDFVSVVVHELAHGLGFLSFVNLSTGAKLAGLNDAYMRKLEDHGTGKRYPEMTNAERISASKNTGNLHWVGAEVIAASGILTDGVHPTGHVEMYAPNPHEPGSSVSHFSPDLAPDQILEPFYTSANHDVGLTLDLLADIGWALAGPLGDVIRPGAVADLATGGPALTGIDLSWTAPGDDGSTGTAASYDIRYAASTITNADWPSATVVNSAPAPLAAGSLQGLTVSSLKCGRRYYFALKASDEAGNVSKLSNVATGKTLVCPTLIVTPLVLPDAENNTAYSTELTINGGFPPYTIKVLSGALPPGLAFGSPVVTGTPMKVGDFSVTIRVTDQVGASTKKTLSLRVRKALRIVTSSLILGRVGRSYNTALEAERGKRPYSWSLIAGALPAGLSFDAATGRISGTPTSPGTTTLTFQVTDPLGGVAEKSFTLTITSSSLKESFLMLRRLMNGIYTVLREFNRSP